MNKSLQEQIYDYIKNNEGKEIDSVDIVHNFNHIVGADTVLEALSVLELTRRVKRVNSRGFNYRYIIQESQAS